MDRQVQTGRRCRGFTLPEVMVTMVIMTVVMGVVGSVYFSSLAVWRRCSAQSQADPPAHISMERITTEMKNAYKITSTLTDGAERADITFLLPEKGGNGLVIYPFQSHSQIMYYLSDATGRHDRNGTHLWRECTLTATGAVTRVDLAGNVTSLQFEGNSTDGGNARVLKAVAMSIAVMGKEGREQYTSSFAGTVAFRN
jgi:prepilin-type N-terminal cleavage/methylation domain-containing protein